MPDDHDPFPTVPESTDPDPDRLEIIVAADDANEPEAVELVLPAEPIEILTTESGVPSDEPLSVPVETASPIDLSPLALAIGTLESTVSTRLDALQSQFDREIRAEATREKVVDRLHAELQTYKQDLLLNTLRPMFIDLIQLHDDIGKILASVAAGETSPDRLPSLVEGFQQGIEDILYRQGVEPFSNDDDAFDPRRQRAVSTQPSPEPSLDRRVAQRLRKGFAAGEKVIRPEIVCVYAAASRPRD
jgi:molecular chaperone GrpE